MPQEIAAETRDWRMGIIRLRVWIFSQWDFFQDSIPEECKNDSRERTSYVSHFATLTWCCFYDVPLLLYYWLSIKTGLGKRLRSTSTLLSDYYWILSTSPETVGRSHPCFIDVANYINMIHIINNHYYLGWLLSDPIVHDNTMGQHNNPPLISDWLLCGPNIRIRIHISWMKVVLFKNRLISHTLW